MIRATEMLEWRMGRDVYEISEGFTQVVGERPVRGNKRCAPSMLAREWLAG